jgi:hypothetical protein
MYLNSGKRLAIQAFFPVFSALAILKELFTRDNIVKILLFYV